MQHVRLDRVFGNARAMLDSDSEVGITLDPARPTDS
jgi:hypothetical protein